jgi:dephospho-CoA kinase
MRRHADERRVPVRDLSRNGEHRPINNMDFVILTGASASGKTTITKMIAADKSLGITCLHFDRRLPELAHARMRHWACFLRNEATRYGILSLDTSKGTIKQMLFDILAIFEQP